MRLVLGLLFALCLVGARADVIETEEAAPEHEEVAVHMTDQQPLALQKAEAKEAAEAEAEEEAEAATEASSEGMRFAESESESESEDYPNAYPLPDGSVVDYDTDEVANDPHVPSARDNWLSNGVIQPQKIPWKPVDPETAETRAEEKAAAQAEEAEMTSEDTWDATVMRESTNTMTQSARCLMYCANGYGLCTRENQKGCACAAGMS